MNDNVIHLAFTNERAEPGARDLLSCAHCKNKTFRAVYQGDQTFPLLQCAACEWYLGRFGWAQE